MNKNIQGDFQLCISVPLNKTQVLTESIDMSIWVIGTSNQVFIRGSYTQNSFLCDSCPFFTPHSICFKLPLDWVVLHVNVELSIVVQKQPSEVFYKKGILKIFKIKLRETLAQVFPCEFCEFFKNTCFTEHL